MARASTSIKLTHTAMKASRSAGYYSVENHPGLYLRVTVSGQRTWVFRSKAGGKTSWLKLGPVLDPITGEGWDHEKATTEAARLRADSDRRRASGDETINPVIVKRAEVQAKKEAEARGKALSNARAAQKAQEEALRPTLDVIAARYLGVFVAEKRRRDGAKRWKDYEQAVYDREIAPRLGAIKIGDIKAKQVAAMRDEIKSESGKRKAVAILRALLSHAKSDGLIENNPAMGIKAPQSGQRSRVLDPSKDERGFSILPRGELKAIWGAISVKGLRAPMLAAIKLELATGQRAGEVLSMRWSDLHVEDREHLWIVPASIAKNGREHIVPLVPQVWALIEAQRPAKDADPAKASPYVFAAYSSKKREKPISTSDFAHCINAMREGLKLDHFTSHDLRRTAATKMAEAKVLPHVIEAVLNHVSGARAGVAGIYNRASYHTEKRRALAQWAKQLDRIAKDQTGAIVVNISAARAKA